MSVRSVFVGGSAREVDNRSFHGKSTRSLQLLAIGTGLHVMTVFMSTFTAISAICSYTLP